MNENPWSTVKQNQPPVSWNSQTKTFHIKLTKIKDIPKISNGIEVQWTPPITYIIRIKEVGAVDWLVGVETPITECSFVNLKPDTEYAVEVTAKNIHRESEPVTLKLRTSFKGETNFA